MRIKGLSRSALKDEFIQASFFSALSTLVKIFTSLVIGKVVANLAGAEGFALFAQMLNFALIVNILTSTCLSQAVTKYVAEYNYANKEKVKKIISTSFRLVSYASLFVGIVLISFSKIISKIILYDSKYWLIVLLFGSTLILYSINTILLAILNGFKSYKKFNILNIVLNVASLGITLSLTFYLKISGVLLSVVLGQSIIVIISLFYLRNETWMSKEYFFSGFDADIFRLLMAFAGMGILTSAISPWSSILIRDFLIERSSLSDAGNYEFVQRIGGIAILFFSGTVSTYFLPRISEIGNTRDLLLEVKKTAKITLPLVFIFLVAIFVLKKEIVLLLGSEEFLASKALFIYVLIGVFSRICAQVLGFVFVAKAKIKIVISIEVFYNFILVVSSYVLILTSFSKGAVQAYMYCNIIYLFLVFFAFYSVFLKRRKLE